MTTMVIPLQPRLPELLDAPADATAWVVTVTLLVSAILTPIAGRLGDMFGKRRMLLVLLGLVFVGSVTAALGDSLAPVLVGRALQGAGLAVIPLGIGILRDVMSGAALGAATGLVTASVGLGSSLAQPLSAFLAEHINWHAVFWVGAAVALACSAILLAVVPTKTSTSGGRFDVVGAVGLTAGLAAILIAVSRAGSWGWVPVGALFAGGLTILLAWGWWELTRADPLVDLRTAAQRPVLLTNIASVGVGFILFGGNIVFPRLLQQSTSEGGAGLSLFEASLVIVPAGVAAVLTSFLAGRLLPRVGPKRILISGASCVITAYTAALLVPVQSVTIGAVNGAVAIGAGLAFAALPSLINRVVPQSQTSAANGVNSLMRSLGTSASAAVLAAVLAAFSLESASGGSSILGFHVAFGITLVLAVIVIAIAAAIPERTHGITRGQSAAPDALL